MTDLNGGPMAVEQLATPQVDEYLAVLSEVDSGSGVDGEGHSHPYGRSESFDPAERRAREVTRWSTAVEATGWRRVLGLFDGDDLVGHLTLVGGELPSETHRVGMGMGILRSHRRRGGGSLLLRAAIEWAGAHAEIEWIDLGVFSDNPGAQALYERHGFEVLGFAPDRYRVDGVSIGDVSMTLKLS
ncbi:MAG: GNAT family N-acetyltransferase [Acidimicrobiales bacterium]